MAKRITFKVGAPNRNVNHGPDLAAHGLTMVGPFPGSTTPSRPGPYKSDSVKRPGKQVWSYWNGKNWGMRGTNFDRMLQRKNKASSRQDLPWYGVAKA